MPTVPAVCAGLRDIGGVRILAHVGVCATEAMLRQCYIAVCTLCHATVHIECCSKAQSLLCIYGSMHCVFATQLHLCNIAVNFPMLCNCLAYNCESLSISLHVLDESRDGAGPSLEEANRAARAAAAARDVNLRQPVSPQFHSTCLAPEHRG